MLRISADSYDHTETEYLPSVTWKRQQFIGNNLIESATRHGPDYARHEVRLSRKRVLKFVVESASVFQDNDGWEVISMWRQQGISNTVGLCSVLAERYLENRAFLLSDVMLTEKGFEFWRRFILHMRKQKVRYGLYDVSGKYSGGEPSMVVFGPDSSNYMNILRRYYIEETVNTTDNVRMFMTHISLPTCTAWTTIKRLRGSR